MPFSGLPCLRLSWFALEAALYHSPTADLTFTDGNSFGDSGRGGSLRYENNRLTLHWAAFELDLVHTSRDQWKGYLRRPGFQGMVVLRRPCAGTRKSWLEGAWLNAQGSLPSCLHIAAQPSGRYLAWSDDLQLRGLWRFANGIPRPSTAPENFGSLIDVEAAGLSHATITAGAHSGMCCSHTFVVSRSGPNAFTRIDSPAVHAFPPRATTWRRMPQNACLVTPP